MFRPALPLVLWLASALPLFGQLNLSAVPQEYVSQGIIYQELMFRDGAKTVTMELPSRWTFRSTATRLDLIPPGNQVAEGRIEALPLPEPTALDAEALEQQVLSSVAPGAQDIKVMHTTPNPGGPGGGDSFEVMISYKALGTTLWSSTTFVNMPQNRLVLRFTAPEADFPALHLGFRRAMSSWGWK